MSEKMMRTAAASNSPHIETEGGWSESILFFSRCRIAGAQGTTVCRICCWTFSLCLCSLHLFYRVDSLCNFISMLVFRICIKCLVEQVNHFIIVFVVACGKNVCCGVICFLLLAVIKVSFVTSISEHFCCTFNILFA